MKNGTGAHPTSYSPPSLATSTAVKRRGREADRSPPSNAQDKNAWSRTAIAP